VVGETAICFVLAKPRQRRFTRRRRSIARSDRPSSWSPARRLGYAAGLRACAQSLRRRHRSVPRVILLRPDVELTLADVDEVLPIDPRPYASIPVTGAYWGREVFYKLAVFNVRGYERILYLDCDTIVLGDISPLWDLQQYSEKSLYGVRECDEMGVHPSVFGKFNTGVMLINRPLLSDTVHRRMLDIARTGKSYDGGDQGVINQYLDEELNTSVGDLEPAYNVLVNAKIHGQWDKFKDDIKILHYTNRFKPWALDHSSDVLFDLELKGLWDEAYGMGSGSYASRPVSES
jgi:hypothetical protein